MHLVKIFFISLITLSVQAKLVDKIVGVFDDEILTLSQINRVKKNIASRKQISPEIYKSNKINNQETLKLFIHRKLTKLKLEEMGYVVTDDQVDSHIKQTQKRLGFRRADLLSFLKTHHTTFEEYFEVIRETIEFNIFVSRVISPMITITDQEIKNTYYKSNSKNKTLSFKYDLVDYSISKNLLNRAQINSMPSILERYQTTGILPNDYKEISTSTLENINEDALEKNLSKLLRKTDEGSYSSSYKLGNDYHVFFIKKKDLVESEKFIVEKNKIYGKLYKREVTRMIDVWFKSRLDKHYIRNFATK